jgi:hypothetical protein
MGTQILTDIFGSFTNIITNQTQLAPGPIWKGGLFADEMGLGKTLSMIALIASDHINYNAHSDLAGNNPTRELRSTLVVLPLNSEIFFKNYQIGGLMKLVVVPVWEFQLKRYRFSHSILKYSK